MLAPVLAAWPGGWIFGFCPMAHSARSSSPGADTETDAALGPALRQAGITLFSCDLDLRYTWIANPLPGLSASVMIGARDDEIFPQEEANAHLALKAQVLSRALAASAEIRLAVPGRVMFVEVRADVVRNEAGRVTGLTGAFVDITGRKAAEAEALRVAEHDRIFAQATREGVLLHDGERVIEANDAFCRMFGLGKDEVVGREPLSFVAASSLEYAAARAAARARGPDEFFGQRSDGSAFP